MVQILIDSEGDLFIPEVEEGVSWQTDRLGTPGRLNFSSRKGNIGGLEGGVPVAFKKAGRVNF